MNKKHSALIFSTIVLSLSLLDLMWLSIGLVIMRLGKYVFQLIAKKMLTSGLNRPALFLLSLLEVAILAIMVRIFVFEICRVPGSSMENTIRIGDYVLINKLAYGPRLPRSLSEIPWLDALYYYLRQPKAELREQEHRLAPTSRRLSGYSTIKRNDILVFDEPGPRLRGKILIKRVVGIAGDTIQISEGILYVNGERQALPKTGKRYYKVYFKPGLGFNHRLHPGLSRPKLSSKVNLTQAGVEELLNRADCDSISPHLEKVDSTVHIWPNPDLNWSLNDFGPVIVPRKGTEFEKYINSENPYLPTAKDLHLSSERLLVPDNYYFVLGDNRGQSFDSRYFGLVSDTQIHGKASMILLSAGKRGTFLKVL